jgi:hypothetical protein
MLFGWLETKYVKGLLQTALLMLVSGIIGFALGRKTAEKPNFQQLHAVAVDCYDSSGNLVANPFEKFGGVITGCAPGQTAKLHQPSPH